MKVKNSKIHVPRWIFNEQNYHRIITIIVIFNDPDRFKPALLRAVNWIFGGCPEASRKAALKRNKIEKEENRETDEWFL